MPLSGTVLGFTASSYGFNRGTPDALTWSGVTKANFTMPAISNQTVGFALDMDAKILHVSINGVWQVNANMGNVLTGLPGTAYPAVTASNGNTAIANFGQNTFKYPVPQGYNKGIW